MLISKNWLTEFVSFPKKLSDEEIANRLSLCTVEVEGIQKGVAKNWDHIVVGEIVELKPHPNADRLRIAMTRVSKNSDPVCIVCGGSNLVVGMKVALALPQAMVRWHGEGELIELELTKIRGVESYGMICSSSEIGLSEEFPSMNDHEILDLSFLDCEAGTLLSDMFCSSDVVFDVDNKSLSNRPDLWGHRGMARELGAILDLSFVDKKIPSIQKSSQIVLTVDREDSALCSRYMAVIVEGVAVQPSPVWMQSRLRSCGIRPINGIVDVTNYVMLELGQPMHAFDYDSIKKKNGDVYLKVRRARKQEKITALDGKEYSLTSEMLLIANDQQPLAVAGVMGGEKSGILPSTSTIVLESANFNASSIRKTSSVLSLSSESSKRFEKHLDPQLPQSALQRAVELYLTLCPGSRVVSMVSDTYDQKEKSRILLISQKLIKEKLGIAIPLKQAQEILVRLGFGVTKKSSSVLQVIVPSFRKKDIVITEDILEEIVRLYGYEHIPSELPVLTPRMPLKSPLTLFIRTLKERLALEYHFHEAHNYAFVKPSTLELCGYSLKDHNKLVNPFSDERPYLCRSLVPNLLEAVEKNQQEHKRIALFEIARVFHGTNPDEQPYFLGCVFTDMEEKNKFAYVKECIASMCIQSGYLPSFTTPSVSDGWWAQEKAVLLIVEKTRIGSIAVVDRRVCEQLGIDREVVACDLNISLLYSLKQSERIYHEKSLFPVVRRDITCVVNESVTYGNVYEALRCAHDLIIEVEPFDVYRGPQVEKNKKSLSFHITYGSTHTLTSEEAEKAHIEIAAALEKKFNAIIR